MSEIAFGEFNRYYLALEKRAADDSTALTTTDNSPVKKKWQLTNPFSNHAGTALALAGGGLITGGALGAATADKDEEPWKKSLLFATLLGLGGLGAATAFASSPSSSEPKPETSAAHRAGKAVGDAAEELGNSPGEFRRGLMNQKSNSTGFGTRARNWVSRKSPNRASRDNTRARNADLRQKLHDNYGERARRRNAGRAEANAMWARWAAPVAATGTP